MNFVFGTLNPSDHDYCFSTGVSSFFELLSVVQYQTRPGHRQFRYRFTANALPRINLVILFVRSGQRQPESEAPPSFGFVRQYHVGTGHWVASGPFPILPGLRQECRFRGKFLCRETQQA